MKLIDFFNITEARKQWTIKDITPSVIKTIKQIAKEVNAEEGYDVNNPDECSQCGWVAEILQNKFGWEAMSGYYVTRNSEPIGDHVWNVLDDGTIIDSTSLQFHEGYDIRIIPPDDPEHKRYRLEWSSDYNPKMADRYPELKGVPWSGEYDFEAAKRLEKQRGKKWWTKKKYQRESVIDNRTQLTELRDMPNVGWRSPKHLLAWLENNGYQYLGQGLFSLVFGKGDYVVKLQKPNLEASNAMQCSIRFHRMAMKSDNPHFPKTHFVKTYVADDGNRKYVYGTERLLEFDIDKVWLPDDKMEAAKFATFLTDYMGIAYPGSKSNQGAIWFIRDLLGPAPDGHEVERFKALAKEYLNSDEPLAIAYKQISEMKDAYNCYLDIDARNVMMRQDGTMVFSDPVVDVVVGAKW